MVIDQWFIPRNIIRPKTRIVIIFEQFTFYLHIIKNYISKLLFRRTFFMPTIKPNFIRYRTSAILITNNITKNHIINSSAKPLIPLNRTKSNILLKYKTNTTITSVYSYILKKYIFKKCPLQCTNIHSRTLIKFCMMIWIIV